MPKLLYVGAVQHNRISNEAQALYDFDTDIWPFPCGI